MEKSNIKAEISPFVAAFMSRASEPKVVAAALKHVQSGDRGERSLDSYKDDIAQAARVVADEFDFDVEAVCIPLIAFHVAGIKLVNDLNGPDYDEEDGAALAQYAESQKDTILKGLGVPEESREAVWQFSLGQAFGVLRGEMSSDYDESEDGISDDELMAIFGNLQ